MRRLGALFSLCLLALSVSAGNPCVVGHRGSNVGVMNTRQAFLNGVEKYHFDALECDVRVTADTCYVISHDETTTAVGGNDTVALSTLAQLQAERYKQTRGDSVYEGGICTMDTYLQICKDKSVIPVIELKWSVGINNKDMSNFAGLYALIERYQLQDRVYILTSMLQSLIFVRQHYPSLRCQYLMYSISEERFDACLQYQLIPSVRASGLTKEDVLRCHDAGMKVAVWTVNNPDDYSRLADWGCDFITTDGICF